MFHRQETGTCHRLAHAAEIGRLDPDVGGIVVPVKIFFLVAFQHVSHAPQGGKRQFSYPDSSSLKKKHLPDNLATPISSTEIEHGMTVRCDNHCTDYPSYENYKVGERISVSIVSISVL